MVWGGSMDLYIMNDFREKMLEILLNYQVLKSGPL